MCPSCDDSVRPFVAMARNNAWSNHRLHRACAALPDTEYHAPRASFFGSLHATLDHILLVDLLYLDRITGQARIPPTQESVCDDFASLRVRQRDSDRELVTLCTTLDADALARRCKFVSYSGQAQDEATGDLLMHLFVHQVHHRGQAHGLLSAAGVEPPQLDEFFLAGDRALRAAELSELGLPDA